MRHVLVGFTGKAGAGKDFIADLLRTGIEREGGLSSTKLPWAKGVRDEIAYELGLFPRDVPVLYDKPTPDSIRRLLQWWGTDFRRSQDPDYWVKWGMASLEFVKDDVVMFPDCRFPNEVTAIQRAGGLIVNVRAPLDVRLRRVGDVPPHESERYADELASDWLVYNANQPRGTVLRHIARDIIERSAIIADQREKEIGE
jgi:hypothetical protein